MDHSAFHILLLVIARPNMNLRLNFLDFSAVKMKDYLLESAKQWENQKRNVFHFITNLKYILAWNASRTDLNVMFLLTEICMCCFYSFSRSETCVAVLRVSLSTL